MNEFLILGGFPDFIPAALWNVLHARREELLGEFRWRSDLKDDVTEYIDQLTVNHTYSILVGVHVRLTDYHAHMNNMYGPSRVPGANYFNKSMSYYRQKYANPLFLVVSNDMKWCQNALKGSDIVYAGMYFHVISQVKY
jgi:galactoside 2-L-fucosyltransferase 1/2